MQPGSSLVILKTAHIIKSAKSASKAYRNIHRDINHTVATCAAHSLQLCVWGRVWCREQGTGDESELQRCQTKPTRQKDLLRKAGGETQPDSLRFPTGPGSRRSSAVCVDTDAAFFSGELPWVKTYRLGLRFGPQPCQCREASWYWR